jgi:hypothetical protein
MRVLLLKALEVFIRLSLIVEKIFLLFIGTITLIVPGLFFFSHALHSLEDGRYSETAINIVVGLLTCLTGADIICQASQREIIVIGW